MNVAGVGGELEVEWESKAELKQGDLSLLHLLLGRDEEEQAMMPEYLIHGRLY